MSLAIILGVYNAYAFLGKQTNSIFQFSALYSGLTVVSENDFNDTIQIQATSTQGTTLYIEGNFDKETRLCKDYENRPNICRNTSCINNSEKSIDEQYSELVDTKFIKIKR